ncbi:hypothetical protein Lalb_Chr19g0132341 [Lupinus albus]|uniref:Uncharacterized protein n=1 Tax=Lupinus albus TaxID=3870 RepID=A0A6A4NTK9_LUPAL|nr:hypothetical protein Lalb_Chr19g0132341 [Lupinus albus]
MELYYKRNNVHLEDEIAKEFHGNELQEIHSQGRKFEVFVLAYIMAYLSCDEFKLCWFLGLWS